MRLIDADRLLTERMKSMYYHLPNGDIAIPIIDIEHAPTIEPKQGEWITEEKESIYGKKIRLKCSECGDTFDVSESAFPYERYCRYCGAKMQSTEGISDSENVKYSFQRKRGEE